MARIDFAPETADRVRGYRLDAGSTYGRRGNGLTYGWNRDNRADAVVATNATGNVRADTHIAMDGGDTWSINVPNGWYTLSALAGTPDTVDGDYRITAEGQPFVRGEPLEGHPFIEGRAVVRVTDGVLTLASARKSVNNRLCSIAISETAAPTDVPAGVAINWTADSINSPTERVEAGVTRIGENVYVLGGFTENYTTSTPRFDVLDVKTGQWTRLADLPGPHHHIATANDGRYVYTAGGQRGQAYSSDVTDAVYRYDTRTNQWARIGSLPEARIAGTMQLLDGKLHYVGGVTGDLVTAEATHLVLDLADPDAGWTTAAPLPVPADHAGSIVVNGTMYVLGGEIEHGTSHLAQADFFRYDARRDAWTRLPSMPTPLSHQEAGILTDGVRIFTLAGMTSAQQLSSAVYSFDLRTGEWSEHTSLPAGRKGGFAWLDGNRFHYLTGEETAGGLPTGGYVGDIVGPQRVRRA